MDGRQSSVVERQSMVKLRELLVFLLFAESFFVQGSLETQFRLVSSRMLHRNSHLSTRGEWNHHPLNHVLTPCPFILFSSSIGQYTQPALRSFPWQKAHQWDNWAFSSFLLFMYQHVFYSSFAAICLWGAQNCSFLHSLPFLNLPFPCLWYPRSRNFPFDGNFCLKFAKKVCT